MSDVFLSYSRRDSAFVQKLVSSLADDGREIWLDTEGIADGEVFPQALQEAIEGSDSFVFVITPDSADSAYCAQEVEHARATGKRILPVLRVPVADASLPEDIRVRNWIPFLEDSGYADSVARLIVALDHDLESTKAHTRWLLKALEWDSEGRERSLLLRGTELAAAERWLAGAGVSDPAPTSIQRAYLLASRDAGRRRQRMIVAASAVVTVISVSLLVFALISRSAVNNERITARSQALAAESQAQLPNDPEVSVILAARAVREKATAQSRFALRAALDASPLLSAFPTLPDTGQCTASNRISATLSPGGRQVAEIDCHGTLLLYDDTTGRPERRAQLAGILSALAYTPDGQFIVAGTGTGAVVVDANTGAVRRRLTDGQLTEELAISPNGHTLAVDNATGVVLWSLLTGRRRVLEHDTAEGGTLTFNHTGRLLIVGGTDATVHIYDAASGRLVHRIVNYNFSDPDSWPLVVALSRDGNELAVGYPTVASNYGNVAVYDTRTWRKLDASTVVTLPYVEISALAFSPDGSRLAIGAEDGTAGVWSSSTGVKLASYDGASAAVTDMSFSPDGRRVLTSADDGTVRQWRSLGSDRAFIPVRSDFGYLQPVGNTVVIAGGIGGGVFNGDTVISRVQVTGGKPAVTHSVGFPGSGDQGGVAISGDGRVVLVAAATAAGPSTLWNAKTERPIRHLPLRGLYQIAIAPGDRLGAGDIGGSSTSYGRAAAFSLTSVPHTVALAKATPCGDGQTPESFAWSADGRYLAGADYCGFADVWTASGRLVRQVNDGGEVSAVGLSADGSRLLVSSWDSRATIFSVATGRPLVQLIGHTRGISDAVFSPNDALVATVGLDDTVRVWNARTGLELRLLSFAAPQGPIAFSPDGREIAVGEDTPTKGTPDIVQVFDACPGCTNARTLLRLASSRETDRLTVLERTIVGGA